MNANGKAERTQNRYYELKRMLEERRFEIIGEVQSRIRDVRDEDAVIARQSVRDEAETCELDIQDDIKFALLQMKAETLEKIGEALARLEQGRYGRCYECGEDISERRLRALPFAVRCTQCEEAREIERQRERVLESRQGPASLFTDLYS